MESQGIRPRIQEAWRSPADQLAAFNSGHSKLKFGFHNVIASDGSPEALAVDLLDDDAPLKPSRTYIMKLAAAAQKQGLASGVFFDLPAILRQGLQEAIDQGNYSAPVKLGWDPCHIQVSGITPTEAKNGKRP